MSDSITRAARVLHGLMHTAVLGVSLAFGTAALGQTQSDAADRDMADRYYRAAQAGNDEAQFYLGALYAAGVGRPQSDFEAFEWFQRAAERGHAHAMLVAAGLTALGKGTPKDNVVSYKWAFLVAEGSQQVDMKNSGRQLVGMLEPRLSASEIQRAKTMAYQFRAIGTPAAAPTAVTPAPAAQPLATAPATAPAAAPPAQTTSTPPQPASEPPASTSAADEAKKRLGKDNADRLIKNVPPEYRKRLGL